ncbi:hypothetical protein MTR67_042285 [Solanum verrucosum]|uniref:Uncharacterized protein n=1 Tax=Solanum verrucosum TaxID=315347 RepID=A0AAF0UN66_SOLVR|nr:hypothetical protein MTR67_042285 [Solanum verrucosum]
MEPFQDRQGLEDYRRLRMQHAVANSNGKIWAFMDEVMEYEIVRDEDQMLTLKLHNQSAGMDVMVSLVYAKCTQIDRLILWESMSDLASTKWMVGGDFNVICNEEEKLGGRPVTEAEVRDFNYCINVCNLEDRGFKGSKYTWWNGRLGEECIFKRLDRVLGDEKLQDDFSDIRSGAYGGRGGSQVWKKMLQARDLIDHQILWSPRSGTASVWHDNWTGLGDLYTVTGEDIEWDYRYGTIKELTNQGEWDTEVLGTILPSELV